MEKSSLCRHAVPLLLIVASLCAHVPAVQAGAWSQQKGHYYAKFSGIFYSANEVYNDMGRRQAMGGEDDEFTGSQGFLYLEYGLMDRLTLIGQASGGRLTSTNLRRQERTRGIGDVDIGLKYQLTDGPIVLAPFATIKVPTGYHEDYAPPLGTGEVDLEFRLLAARSLYPLPLYIGIESGYRVRGGPYSNQIPYFVEVGWTPHKSVFLKGFVEGKDTRVASVEDLGLVGGNELQDLLDGIATGSVTVSEGDFTKIGFNGAYNLAGPVWIDLLLERAIRGENIGAGASWGLGLSYSY